MKITYDAGDANLYELVLTIPSNNKVNTEKVSEESGTVVHSGISTSGIAALVDGCSTEGVYRSYNLFGSMSNISVNTKYFGSCVAADY